MVQYNFRRRACTLSDQLRDAIVEMLQTEKFDGNKLPAESKISKRFGVSIASVREALLLLREEGVITKKHGSGNYFHLSALNSAKRLDQFKGFNSYLEASGYVVTEKINNMERTKAPGFILEPLNLSPDDEIIHYDRAIFADGHPAIYCDNYLPIKLFDEIPDELHAPLSILDVFWTFMRKDFAYAHMEFMPFLTTEQEFSQIGVLPGVPSIIMNETYFSIENEPLAFSSNKFNHAYVTISVFGH